MTSHVVSIQFRISIAKKILSVNKERILTGELSPGSNGQSKLFLFSLLREEKNVFR